MAVLKSPRNSRNKKKWATRYSNSIPNQHYRLEAKKNPRSTHKLQHFLDTTWKRIDSSPTLLEQYREVEMDKYLARDTRPNYLSTHIRLGYNSFKISKAYPQLFQKEWRNRKVRKNILHLANANSVVRF